MGNKSSKECNKKTLLKKVEKISVATEVLILVFKNTRNMEKTRQQHFQKFLTFQEIKCWTFIEMLNKEALASKMISDF